MEMLLMGGVLSLFALAVTCLAFSAATRSAREPEPVPELKKVRKEAPARFFAPGIAPGIATLRVDRAQVPIEALLLQIESHVRLEHAAAESFLEDPTTSLLHSRTMSPLIQ
jgi:hypothetical protein